MKRRDFITTTGAAVAASALPFTLGAIGAQPKNIRIGIIGAENSHTAGLGKIFNTDKKFPGAEVKYVWGETDEFAKRAMERGNIPNQVKDPAEMLGKIDALIVDHRHPKFHIEAATPFIKEGIPTFIDKPFCYRAAEGKEFLEMARKAGTPVTSYSSIAQSAATFDIKKQLEALGEISQVVRYGPVDLDSQYGGVFFYGVHMVQPLLYIFGEDVKRVRISRNGKYEALPLHPPVLRSLSLQHQGDEPSHHTILPGYLQALSPFYRKALRHQGKVPQAGAYLIGAHHRFPR